MARRGVPGGAFTWTAGANGSVPIFDAGANRGNLAFARAQRELFLARYEQVIQTAFREVSDALARRGTFGAQFGAQTRLIAAAQDSFTLNEARYRNGIASFVEVNPLPGVHPINSDLVILARPAGISHPDLIGRIVNAAIRRWAA